MKFWHGLVLALVGYTGSWALQGGPVQPDYLQFESADMPDLVNLYTGDFAYSIPLGELPGPYGGFPISMSYHAGITPQQEASWVGLGWTLNPGAINRTVRGVPDDQIHGGTLGYIYQYSAMSAWGINAGWTNGAVSVGVTVSSFGGVGLNATVGPSISGVAGVGFAFGTSGVGVVAQAGPEGSPASVNGSFMIGQGGKPSLGVGAGLKGQAIGASVGASITPGEKVSKSAGFSVGQSVGGAGVGMSVSGNGVRPAVTYTMDDYPQGANTVSVSGTGLSVSNVNNGRSESEMSSAGFFVAVPTPIGLFSLGYNQTLYETWVRQATTEYTYGYMYQAGPAVVADQPTDYATMPTTGQGSATSTGPIPWNWTFKGRSLEYVGNPDGDLHPAYDIYSVAGPGIGGSFRPFALNEHSLHMSMRAESDDASPAPYSYVLKSAGNDDVQILSEFEKSNSYENLKYAYWYKESSTSGRTDFVPQNHALRSIQDAKDQDFSPYASMNTYYLNEGNRLIYLSSSGDGDRVRSRMEFRFIGHNAGYYESENTETENDEGLIESGNFQKKVNGWNYALIGSQRVEPILAGNSPIGKLQGFRLIAADGSKYTFAQPVRSYLKVDYSINQQTGLPMFMDSKGDAGASLGSQFVDALKGLAESALYLHPEYWFFEYDNMFKGHLDEVCKVNEQAKDRLFSYQINPNPYATQWLLTEVQGVDYVAYSGGEIGHHVKLTYTEPSLYRWRFPYVRPDLSPLQAINYKIPRMGNSPEGCSSDMYSASFGYKELVYLQSIETSTHKAVFHLNGSDKRRIDGKGWETPSQDFDQAAAQLPMYVTATLKLELSSGSHSLSSSSGNPFASSSSTARIEAPLDYHVKAVYLNTELTDEQAEQLVGKTIYLAGMGEGYQQQEFNERFGYIIDASSYVSENGTPVSGLLPIVVDSYERVTDASESKWGLYKIIPKTNSPTLYGSWAKKSAYSSSPTLISPDNSSDKHYIWVGENVSASFAGEGDYVMMVKSPFPVIDLSALYTIPTNTTTSFNNEMRYLDSITYCRKSSEGWGTACSPSYRTFQFAYDYSLQPGTVNSYCDAKRYPTTNQEMSAIPTHVGTDACQYENGNHLFGKLTLESVTEKGCRFGECASLPPFRFAYNSPSASPLRIGSMDALKEWRTKSLGFYVTDNGSLPSDGLTGGLTDVDVSVLNSNDQTDDWGFWNWTAHLENHKVNQDIADYAGSTWSLQKIVDPAGGVLEIEYERDTYKGESFEAEKRYATVYNFGQCSDYGLNQTDEKDRTCLLMGPLHWKKDCLAGKPAYWALGAKDGQAYEYLDTLGIKQDAQVMFNLASNVQTSVKCGPFGMAHCSRTRSVASYAEAKVQRIETTSSSGILNGTGVTAFMFGVDKWDDVTSAFAGFDAKVLVLDRPWNEVVNSLLRAAKRINPEKSWKMPNSGRYGGVFAPVQTDTLKGGDLRVSRLTRHDMGVTQTSQYQYEFQDADPANPVIHAGEIPQLPDSAMLGILASRVMPAKINEGMPDMDLKPKSRIVGIGDGDLYYLPDARVSYPRVRMMNTVDGVSPYNGYTEFRYVTAESGIPESYVQDIASVFKPFLKLNLRMWMFQNLAQKNYGGRRMVITATDETGHSQTRKILLFEGMQNEVYFYSDASSGFQADKVTQVVLGDGNSTVKRYVSDVTVSLQGLLPSDSKYHELWVTTKILSADASVCNSDNLGQLVQETLEAAIVSHRSQRAGTVPVLYKAVAYQQGNALSMGINVVQEGVYPKCTSRPSEEVDFSLESSIVYHDLSGFLGKAMSTAFYRGSLASAVPVRLDTMIYAVQVPSVRTGLVDNPSSTDVQQKLGRQKETWDYTKTLFCKNMAADACKDGYPKLWQSNFGVRSISKNLSLVRYPAFLVRTITKTGFNNQGSTRNNTRLIEQTTDNRDFDPLTGQPTVTVSRSPIGGGKEMRKVTRVTPHWYTASSSASSSNIANTMFERNMFAQNFLEELFSWNSISEQASVDLASSGSHLRNVKLFPFTYATSLLPSGSTVANSIGQNNSPIVSLGEFTSRVLPSSVTTPWTNYQFTTPPLSSFNGTKINRIDKWLKVAESEDVLGRKLASHYSDDGLYQTGVFYPAAKTTTFLWSAKGKNGVDISGKNQSDALAWISKVRVEFQLHASSATSVTLTLGSDSKTISLTPGLKNYSIVLDPGSASGSGTLEVDFGNNIHLMYMRAYPVDAQAKTFRYDEYGSMIQSVDERNVSTYFEYDVFGQLQQIRNDEGVVFKSHSREMVNGGN